MARGPRNVGYSFSASSSCTVGSCKTPKRLISVQESLARTTQKLLQLGRSIIPSNCFTCQPDISLLLKHCFLFLLHPFFLVMRTSFKIHAILVILFIRSHAHFAIPSWASVAFLFIRPYLLLIGPSSILPSVSISFTHSICVKFSL